MIGFALLIGIQALQTTSHQILIDVDAKNSEAYDAALHNAEVLKKTPHMQVEILCHGPGIDMLSASGSFGNRIAADAKHGVVFAACSKSMAHNHLDPKDLVHAAKVVDSGSAELARKKKAGWIYVKPSG